MAELVLLVRGHGLGDGGARAGAGGRQNVTEQAKGLLMGRHGCETEQAWQMLVQATDHAVGGGEVAAALTAQLAGVRSPSG